MKTFENFLIVAAFALLAVSVSSGEEMELREWKSNLGTSITARLDSLPEGELTSSEIILTTADGRKIQLPFSKLSEPDQRWIAEKSRTRIKTTAPDPGAEKPMDATVKTFDILTERDVADPSELLFTSPGGFDENRLLIMTSPDIYRRFGLEKYPDHLVMAAFWHSRKHIHRKSKLFWVDVVKDAFQSDTTWWNPFPEKSANDLLRVLAQNNRKIDGSIALKRVAYRTGIEPTKKELERINGSFAYAELTASLVVEGKIKDKVPLVVVGLRNNDLRFIHGFTYYEGKLQRIDRTLADAIGVGRSDGLQIAEVTRHYVGKDSFEPVLTNSLKSRDSGILIGDSFGKMMTLSPEFIPAKP